jgi:hypothetical protein
MYFIITTDTDSKILYRESAEDQLLFNRILMQTPSSSKEALSGFGQAIECPCTWSDIFLNTPTVHPLARI